MTTVRWLCAVALAGCLGAPAARKFARKVSVT